jgi:hypothetical protein
MRAHLIIAVAVATMPLAACSGGSSKAESSPTPTVAPTAPADIAAATAAIKKDWSDFFSASVPFSQKGSLLEDSASLAEALTLSSKNPAAKLTSAEVTTVTFTSPTTAEVLYTLSIDENPVLKGANGTAVLQDGTWRVSKFTFCQLQKLGSKKPVPGCV